METWEPVEVVEVDSSEAVSDEEWPEEHEEEDHD